MTPVPRVRASHMPHQRNGGSVQRGTQRGVRAHNSESGRSVARMQRSGKSVGRKGLEAPRLDHLGETGERRGAPIA